MALLLPAAAKTKTAWIQPVPIPLQSFPTLEQIDTLSRSDIGEFSMRSQETRLRRKRGHMPCNLVNFILMNQESEFGWGWQQGEEKTRQKKKKSRKNPSVQEKVVRGCDQLAPPRIRRCPVMSGQFSFCVGMDTLARAEPSSEAARRRARGL